MAGEASPQTVEIAASAPWSEAGCNRTDVHAKTQRRKERQEKPAAEGSRFAWRPSRLCVECLFSSLPTLSAAPDGKKPKTRILLIFLLLWPFLGSCWPEAEWTDLRGSATDCVLAIFPPDATIQEITAFLEEHTQGPPHPGGGYTQKAGIGAVIKRGIDEQTAYEICFRPDADPAEVSATRQGIKSSPFIERMLEGEEAERAVSGDES